MGILTELDDLALIRQIQHGNEAALEDFYQRFAPGLHALIRRRVREPHDIEDVLADTMSAAVTAIMRFKGQSQVFTWLCRIAQFKIADYYRRAGRDDLPLDEVTATSNLEETNLEENLMIWQALLQLNHEYRIVLEKKYFVGYSTREIAFHLGRTEKAIESVLVRARQAFAHEYRRLEQDGGVRFENK